MSKSINDKIVLNENVHMCSGVCCPLRDDCYRHQLNNFYDVIAQTPHRDPVFVEPAYNARRGKCLQFLETELQGS